MWYKRWYNARDKLGGAWVIEAESPGDRHAHVRQAASEFVKRTADATARPSPSSSAPPPPPAQQPQVSPSSRLASHDDSEWNLH